MSRSTFTVLSFLLAIGITGCSQSSEDQGGLGDLPQNAADALAQLTPEHKQNFENWKQQLTKSCNASEVFGLSSSGREGKKGLDGALVLQRNGGSALFADETGFVLLTSASGFAGISTTKSEQSLTVNGKGYRITAETKREGSNCAVYLFGQKVHETTIFESFTIGALWSNSNDGKISVPASTPSIKSVGATGMAEARGTELEALLRESFRPSVEGLPLLARKLGLTSVQARDLFEMGNATDNIAFRLSNEPSTAWSSIGVRSLLAREALLKDLFDEHGKALTLEVRLPVWPLSLGGAINSTDQGNLKLNMTILLGRKNAERYAHATQSVRFEGLADFDPPEALECARTRALAYVGGPNKATRLEPSVETMFAPCRTLDPQVEKAGYERGMLKDLVAEVFAGVFPSPKIDYNGWDEVLSRVATETLEAQQDIRAELDPTSKAPTIALVATLLGAIDRELERTKNAAPLKTPSLQMGLSWAFTGRSISVSRIAQIIHAADNSVDPFEVSTRTLLQELGRQPELQDSQLAFAEGLTEEYKKEALKALGLARDLDYAEFERALFNSVIQQRTALSEFKDASSYFATIKTELAPYSRLASVKGPLVALSVSWLKADRTTRQQLAALYAAVDNVASIFEESTRDWLQSLSGKPAADQETVVFAQGISDEYKQLADAIRNNATAAGYEDWGKRFFRSVLQERPSLGQVKAWNGMWVAALAFTAREKARTQDEFGSGNEWNRKAVLEVAVKETWSEAEFTGLEAIAEVARGKSWCERHKGASSLADCAGLSLFSKKKGMFFDPNFGSRYQGLATEFRAYLGRLNPSDWFSLRNSLLGGFFDSTGPLWSKCDQAAFSQKADTLDAQINAVLTTADTFKKWELERKIKDTLENCRP